MCTGAVAANRFLGIIWLVPSAKGVLVDEDVESSWWCVSTTLDVVSKMLGLLSS